MTNTSGFFRQTGIIAAKELRDALRNRWFLLFSILFAALTCVLASVSMAGTGRDGMAGFGRTAAGLINVVLLIVPLMALSVGAATIAGERERGTLEYLLAHPLSRGELLAGKYIGSAIALLAALALGFGASMMIVAFNGRAQQATPFLVLVLFTAALALAMLSVGLLISVLCRRTSIATGAAILTWFCLIFLSDLGLMGATLWLHLSAKALFLSTLVNPMQAFKMSVLGGVHAALDVLGPTGAYAMQEYGARLPLLFAATLASWIVAPVIAAYVLFSRGGDA